MGQIGDISSHLGYRSATDGGMTVRNIRPLSQLIETRPAERHWVRGDRYATALLNAMSVVFPFGETFMIRSLHVWRDRLPPELAADVDAFIGQEAGHSREHLAFNRFITRSGYQIRPLEVAIRNVATALKSKSEIGGLCATACIEHFTAIIAAEILRNPHHLENVSPELKAFWLWHGIEELEHKGVAYDVWNHATRDWPARRRYWLRSKVMVLIALSFLINRTKGQLELHRQDGVGKLAALWGTWRQALGRNGILASIILPWCAFFRPGFHPWQCNDAALIDSGTRELAGLLAEVAHCHAQRLPRDPAPAELSDAA